jgi:cysteine synthase B
MSVLHSNPVQSAASPASGRRPEGVLALVGNTPLIELKRIAAEVAPVRIFGKAEWFNPGGSVKDRPAMNMLLDGERRGELTPGKIILDATSGNTGIAYAMFGAALGYKVRLCVPKTTGALHQRILKSYGAELVYTPGTLGSDGAIEEARRLYAENPALYFYPDQYNNPANWQAHYHGTSIEIIRQTEGRLTHFVSALGTSGTFTGNGRRFREFNRDIRLISVQPDSPMHGLEGLKHMETSIRPGFYDESLADETRFIATEDAQAMVKRLAREEGLMVGLSAGAAVTIALEVAREIKQGTIVTILCDGAGKYLDHQFWDRP